MSVSARKCVCACVYVCAGGSAQTIIPLHLTSFMCRERGVSTITVYVPECLHIHPTSSSVPHNQLYHTLIWGLS